MKLHKQNTNTLGTPFVAHIIHLGCLQDNVQQIHQHSKRQQKSRILDILLGFFQDKLLSCGPITHNFFFFIVKIWLLNLFWALLPRSHYYLIFTSGTSCVGKGKVVSLQLRANTVESFMYGSAFFCSSCAMSRCNDMKLRCDDQINLKVGQINKQCMRNCDSGLLAVTLV